MIEGFSTVNRRRVLTLSGGALATGFLPLPTRAADYPPTEGEMQGFVLLKDRAKAPDVPFFDANDNVRHFSDFGGQVLLVNFWATWCQPCIHELPDLDNLSAQLGGPDFKVLTISQDRGGARVAKPFLEDKLGLRNLEVFVDRKMKLGRALGVRGLPSTYLIDRCGDLVGGLVGIADWDSSDAIRLIQHVLDEAPHQSSRQTTNT